MRIIYEKSDLLRILSKELKRPVGDLTVIQAEPLEIELQGVEYEPLQESSEKVVQAPAERSVEPKSTKKKEDVDDGVSPEDLLKRSRNLVKELKHGDAARLAPVEDTEF